MRTHARAVVIGGGVVGVSTLYHLARKGWSDVVLVERRELTSGSTWHAAGLLPLFNLSYSVGQIHKYSVALYETLEAETGQNVGFRKVSNIRLARTRDRWDEYMYYAGVARTIGVKVNVLTPDEVKAIWPLCETDGLIGAIQHPDDGYIQPADLTQAFAKGARALGAEINRHTTVTAIEARPSGEWLVKTDKGDIVCEHVVSATGNFARRTGAMVGLDVPVLPVEHQYIVTEPHPAIVARRAAGPARDGRAPREQLVLVLREENGGFLLGPYEKGAPACYVDGPRERRRIRAVPGGSRPPRAAYRDGDRPRSRLRRGRRQEGLQRRHRLYARRQPDRRPGLGRAEFLAERGPQLRRHRRRRRRLAARRVDRRGRADHRHARRRPAPLRPLCDARLSQGEERGGLFASSSPSTTPTRSGSRRGR